MTSTPGIVALAALSALCYAAAAVLQQREARKHEDDTAFLLRLVRRPAWVAGLVINAAGFVLQALALQHGDLALVQPVLVLSVVFSTLLASLARHESPSSSAWLGVVAITLGLATFFVAGRPGGGTDTPIRAWSPALLATGAAAGAALLLSRVAPPTGWGLVAGILFGLAACLTKMTVEAASHGVRAIVLAWPLYGLVVSTALAFVAMQTAFRTGPLVCSFPALIATDPLTASLLGAWLFGEGLQGAAAGRVLAAVGIFAVLAGIRVVAASPLLALPDENERGTRQAASPTE